MKRCGWLVGLVLCVTGAWAQDNLLPSGDFEAATQVSGNWGFATWSTAPSRAVQQWSAQPHSGARALEMVGLDNAGAEAVRSVTYSQPVDVSEGVYKLTGYYRTTGAASAQIQVHLHDQTVGFADFGAPTVDRLYLNLGQAPQWTSFDFDLNLRPGVKQVVFLLRATDLGAVAFDDLALRLVTAPLSMKLYPADYGRGGAWPLAPGAPNFVRVMLMGDRSRFRAAELRLDLPPGVSDFGLLGASEPVTRDGHRFTRYHVSLTPELLQSLTKTVSHCGLTLWLDAGKVAPGAVAWVQLVADGQPLEARAVPLKLLPPLPAGPRSKTYRGLFCWGLFGDVPQALWPRVYDMVRGMGVTHHLAYLNNGGWTDYLNQRLRADGGQLWANVPHVYETMVYEKGAETRIIAAGLEAFRPYADHYRKLSPLISGAFWDWEPPNAQSNPLWDDAPTVAAFAAREKLDPATLTPERLQGELRTRFLAFRTWQLGEVMRLWAASVREVRPDLTIAICQGSGMPPDRNVDYTAYDDIPNLIHLPMIYTSGAMDFARNVAGLREYLPRATVWPMTSTSMVADGLTPAAKSPRSLYFDYLTPAFLGAVGCSHWPDLVRGMDMEYVWELSRAMRDLGAVDRFVCGGQRNPAGMAVRVLPESETRVQTARGPLRFTSPQWDRFALSFAYAQGGQRLAVVCNMHPDKPATALVTATGLKGAGWHAYDAVSRRRLVPAKGQTWTAAELARGLQFETPPLSTGLLVLSREAPAGGFAGSASERDVRQRLAARSAQTQARGGAGTLKDGALTINWEDMDADGSAEVRIATPDQELGLGTSGNLWSWRVRGQELVNRFDGAGACQDRFWWPTEARASEDAKAEYELVNRDLRNGRATVSFRRRLSHAATGGLVLEKTYDVPGQGRAVQVTVTVRNESPQVHEFSYWSHGALRLGGTPSLSLPTAAGPQVFAGPDQPREVWALMPGVAAGQPELLGSPVAATLAAPECTLGPDAGPRVVVKCEPSLLQLYRWWDGTDQARYTLEWMYQKQRLVTGQSWTTRYEMTVLP